MVDLCLMAQKGRTFEAFEYNLLVDGKVSHGRKMIPEDANITLRLQIVGESLNFGEPKLWLGDLELDMILESASSEKHTWLVEFADGKTCSDVFKNRVGQCELVLLYSISDIRISLTVEIEANIENARFAKEMLLYLEDNYDSIVQLCFSVSKVSGGRTQGKEQNLNSLIEEANSGIDLCERLWPRLLSRLRETSVTELSIKVGEVPDSLEGIAWLAQSPDELHPCHPCEQNLMVNGLPVRIHRGAVSQVISDKDLPENRVIHGYLAHLGSTLRNIRRKLNLDLPNYQATSTNSGFGEYVNLDHILQQYRQPIINALDKRIGLLVSRTDRLIYRYSEMVPVPYRLHPIQPMISPFVARTPVYLHLFQKISDWYKLGKTELKLGDILYGLRHLSTLYELTVMTQLIYALDSCGFKRTEQSYRDYFEGGFGGIEKERPSSQINNYFQFTSKERGINIELLYEPVIWTSNRAIPGDPVDVYRPHYQPDALRPYRRPDYLLRVHLRGRSDPVLLVFDAKYSSGSTVRTYSLNNLISKYLLGMHQQCLDGSYAPLPIQAVWALYPKGSSSQVNYYANKHSLMGSEPILPSLGAYRIRPCDEKNLAILLAELLRQIEREC